MNSAVYFLNVYPLDNAFFFPWLLRYCCHDVFRRVKTTALGNHPRLVFVPLPAQFFLLRAELQGHFGANNQVYSLLSLYIRWRVSFSSADLINTFLIPVNELYIKLTYLRCHCTDISWCVLKCKSLQFLISKTSRSCVLVKNSSST